MFDTGLECGIKAVKIKVQNVKGRSVRRCRVLLVHPFSKDVARKLGKDAVQIREGLRNGAVDKAVLPISGIAAIGALTVGKDAIKIPRLVGVTATLTPATKKDDDDEGPTVLFEFEFGWQEDAWLFLGRHCSAVAEVVLTKRQLSLAGDDSNN